MAEREQMEVAGEAGDEAWARTGEASPIQALYLVLPVCKLTFLL